VEGEVDVANENAVENPEAPKAKSPGDQSSDEEKRYQLYVRVPKGPDDPAAVQGFLQELADWLSNSEHNIEVLPYDEEYEAYIAKPAGDRASPLYPMYVCHNRN
jgi:hypothetical protein